MKVFVLGIEGSQGIGAKSGKAYDMGKVFMTAPLAPPMGGNVAKGSMGYEVECVDSEVVRRVAHLPLPFEAECDIRTVMKFGAPKQTCFEIKPTAVVK